MYSNKDEVKANKVKIARGMRLRAIREALRLSRRKFADRFLVPKGTLQNWEEGRYRGLSEKGAARLISALRANGTHCSIEWLMFGTGQPPSFPEAISTRQKILQQQQQWPAHGEFIEAQIIQQELLQFHRLNPNSIDTIVSDNAMAPVYLMGDLVAGRRFFNDDLAKTIGYACIIQTTAGDILVRKLKKGTKQRCYNLIAFNSNKEKTTHKNITVFSAAPILWMRRENPCKD